MKKILSAFLLLVFLQTADAQEKIDTLPITSFEKCFLYLNNDKGVMQVMSLPDFIRANWFEPGDVYYAIQGIVTENKETIYSLMEKTAKASHVQATPVALFLHKTTGYSIFVYKRESS